MMMIFFAVHFPDDGRNPSTPPDKPPRSMSQTKSSGRKSKRSTIKRKSGKTNERNGEAKWYLETSSINMNNNNNNNDNTTISSTISTPSIDRSTRKLGKFKKIIYDFVIFFIF